MLPLPIDAVLGDVRAALSSTSTTRALVVEAPPGTGKTTRIPPALLDVCAGEIVVLEPRRLAARMAARRVAEERGEPLGETVGYVVRFDQVGGPRTRLRYVTEGILTRRLLAEPDLPGVDAVVLDELHERHLQADLALGLLKRLQGRRPDLRLVAMSATLDAAPVAAYLGGCPVLSAAGRRFDVAVEHIAQPDERPLANQVASALRKLAETGLDGDVLVFLPGAHEIQRARTACAPIAARHGLDLVLLHGDLSSDEQDRAVRPGNRPKVILSTNVAETSITVEGVVAVIDGGLARVASHAPWSGMPRLRLSRVSQASATQRAGRAGRVRPGRCLRLYTKHDFDTRPPFELPEVRRLDLAEPLLALYGAGSDAASFPWLEPPPAASIAAAEALLSRLGAVEGGRLTAVGRRMLRFPAHPRLARMLVAGEEQGVARQACGLAALIGEEELIAEYDGPTSESDLLDALSRFGDAAQSVTRARRQLERLADLRRTAPPDSESALRLCLLTAFPDRVARRRRPGERELLLSSGGSAELSPRSAVRDAPLVVAVDAEEQQTGSSRRTIVRAASAIDEDWLLDLYPASLSEERDVVWSNGRVEVVSRLRYDALVLDERRGPPTEADAEAAARLLADAVLPGLLGDEELVRWRQRVAFVARTFPEAELVPPDDDDVRQALAGLCLGRRTRDDVSAGALVEALRGRLPSAQVRLVAEAAPDRVTLPGGRSIRVAYEADQPPWIASRLQDFFGLSQGPSIARGRVPLVLHLLAPNQRPVQVTTDLAGFWTRHYPAIRRELARRYPKHAWPEDPTRAAPTKR